LTFLSTVLNQYIAEDNPVRVVDVFVDELDLTTLGFDGIKPEATGRPAHHPTTLLKIYIYGYLSRIQSSRSLERETRRNVELIWLAGRLMPAGRPADSGRLATRHDRRPVVSALL
jgi:transposase